MKKFLSYFKQYFKEGFNPIQLIFAIIVCSVGYYFFYIEGSLKEMRNANYFTSNSYLFHLCIYGLPFIATFLVGSLYHKNTAHLKNWKFWATVLFAIGLFTARSTSAVWSADLRVYSHSFEYPGYWFKLFLSMSRGGLILLGGLIFWLVADRKNQPYYGFTLKNFDTRPYLALVALSVPLILWASFQTDFQHSYPRAKNVPYFDLDNAQHTPYFLLYEFFYLLDFVSIEFFFRGFLILAICKYAKTDVLIAMATFYFIIHFGKPGAETISSFLGGMLLGVITYYSKSIIGGIIVHMGLAAMMEIGGWFGNVYLK